MSIFTDGSGCAKGPGGWAAILRSGSASREISGSDVEATNNSMEVTAALMGLRAIRRPAVCEVVTDSEYLQNGARYGIPKWKRNGWSTATGEEVKNRELWEGIAAEIDRHISVEWVWVRGHSGHPENERCDFLAAAARASLLPPKRAIKSKHGALIKKLEEAPVELLREAVQALSPDRRAVLREFLLG